jgi:hypothetical protein
MSQKHSMMGPQDQSATLTDFGGEIATGEIRWMVDPLDKLMKKWMLFKAAAAIADGLQFMKDTTTSTEVTVILTTAVTDLALGVNNAGATIASGNYFWGLVEGRGYADPVAAGWADSEAVGPGVAGEATVYAAGSSQSGIAINDDSATVQANVILWSFPSKKVV